MSVGAKQRRAEVQRRYFQTAKGKAAHARADAKQRSSLTSVRCPECGGLRQTTQRGSKYPKGADGVRVHICRSCSMAQRASRIYRETWGSLQR